MEINITINGDVNLILPAEDMELLTTEDMKDEEEFDLAYDQQLVAVISPVKPMEIMTCDKAESVVNDFYWSCECDEWAKDTPMALYYHAQHVLELGEEKYLVGPGVVCNQNDDGEIWSLSGDDLQEISRYLTENLVMLSADGRELPAIRLRG